MAISKSLRNCAMVVEKYVTLPATTGTTVGPSIPANCVVLSAGVEVLTAVPTITTYTVAASDGTTTFMAATSVSGATINTVKAGVTPGFISAADTVDAVTVISGSPGTIPVRIWALVADVNESVYAAADAKRDFLA